MLAGRAGLVATETSTGHYESPAYSDCLRLVCARRVDHFRQREYGGILEPLNGREVILFGAGGDFRAFLAPGLGGIRVAGFYTTSPCSVAPAGVRRLDSLKATEHEGRVVLLASVRFEDEMRTHLDGLGWPADRIFSLGKLLDVLNEGGGPAR